MLYHTNKLRLCRILSIITIHIYPAVEHRSRVIGYTGPMLVHDYCLQNIIELLQDSDFVAMLNHLYDNLHMIQEKACFCVIRTGLITSVNLYICISYNACLLDNNDFND